jgi:hypothetical protein
VVPGAGGTPAGSGGAADGGAPVCMPRDLGSELGIPVVEGVLAGASMYASSCGGAGPEAWFRWTAPASGLWAFDALGSDGNVSVTVLAGSGGCTAFPEIACNTAGRTTVVNLEQGQTVTVVVDTNARTSGYLLSISGPVGEDDFPCGLDVGSRLAAPLRIGRLGQDATFATILGCGPGNTPTVVTAWTSPSSGYFKFDTAGSSFDTLLEVRGGCNGAPNYGCSDDYQGTDARLDLFFEQGTRVSVLLGGKAVVRPEEARYELSIARSGVP